MASTVLTPPAPSVPFDALAGVYDDVFSNSLIGQAQRRAVWRELDRIFLPGQRILELNCGTGVDAIHLAQRGVSVLACDASSRMIEVARSRLGAAAARTRVDFRALATEEIAQLESSAPFDGALSNFAGLNCVHNLRRVAVDLATLLTPGAALLLCVFGRFTVWEMIWHLARGNPGKAFRRLRASSDARLSDQERIQVHYRSINEIKRVFAPQFRLARSRGIGVAVPPSYLEPLAERWPTTLAALETADRFLGRCVIAKSLGDHALLEFERTDR